MAVASVMVLAVKTALSIGVILGLVAVPTLLAAVELAGLRSASSQQLLKCLGAGNPCELKDSMAVRAVVDELIRRRESGRLAATVEAGGRDWFCEQILETLLNVDDPALDRLMRRLMSRSTTKIDYYAALYLAERGDEHALDLLNENFYRYDLSSSELARIAHLFGEARFRKAIPKLVAALGSASNLSAAALDSLMSLFPGSPSDFQSAEAAKRYFEDRARATGDLPKQ